MRLAVAFWSGVQADDPQRALQRLDEIGVKGLGHIAVDRWSEADIERCRVACDARGVFVGEVTLYGCGWPLASADAETREAAVGAITRGFDHALKLDALCVGVSAIADGPEAGDLWSEAVWRRLVSGVKEVAAEAERAGVDLGLHPGNRGPLDAPEQLRRLLDEVGSPRVKVILDPVNMTTHRNYYRHGDFLNETFDLLGPDIIAAHAKDVLLDTSHWVLKLDEVPLGMGHLDYETYVRRLGALDRDVVFTIEHYRDVGASGTVASPVFVDYPDTNWENTRAREYICGVAERVGVEVG